jgi:hypothetical protein
MTYPISTRKHSYSNTTFPKNQHSLPASVTPADMLASFGLNLKNVAQREGFRKVLAGEAPAKADVHSMIHVLNTELHGDAAQAAVVMVAIQNIHPKFVPELDYNAYEFFKNFWTAATTVSGLKVTALWTESGAPFVAELLENPDCSICTLDFSRMDSGCSWSESAFAKNTSVKTWQGCPLGWPGLEFIGPHVHELHLRSDRIPPIVSHYLPMRQPNLLLLLPDDSTNDETGSDDSSYIQTDSDGPSTLETGSDDSTNVETDSDDPISPQVLQTILQQGKIECVSLEAATSAEHLRLAQAVQHANRNGGRVHEVHLLEPEVPQGICDNKFWPEILEILCGSNGVIWVTVPNARRLDRVDLAKLKDWLKKGSVEFLDFAIVPVLKPEADTHQNMMAEITPLLTSKRQLVAISIGTAFGALFWRGARVHEFGTKLEEYLTRRDSKAAMAVSKYVYIRAMQFTHERQAAINQSSLVPHAPASNSPGARIDKLIQAAIICPFPKLGLWLAEGLKKNSIKHSDLDALETALRDRFATAIDAAFNDAEGHRNQFQVTGSAEAGRIAQALFGPDSFATLQSLREHLTLALDGVVSKEEREEFKAQLLLHMRAEFVRAFGRIVN